MPIHKHLPNAFTAMNLFSGCLAVVAATRADFMWAYIFILIGAFFDFTDGFVARLVKVSSEFGKILDSLADVVTFGVAPSFVLFYYIRELLPGTDFCPCRYDFLAAPAFIVAVFSGLRLAKFHLDTRQSTSFIGLPTPANALLISSLVFWLTTSETPTVLLWGVWIFIAISALLLVSEIPMFSLKFKKFKWKGNEIKYFFLFSSIVFIILFRENAMPPIMASYIFYSLISLPFKKKKNVV